MASHHFLLTFSALHCASPNNPTCDRVTPGHVYYGDRRSRGEPHAGDAGNRTEGQEGGGGGTGLARPRARGNDLAGCDRTPTLLHSTVCTSDEAGGDGGRVCDHHRRRHGRALSGHGLNRLLGYLVRVFEHRPATHVERS